jgi:putative ABC transport system permease protein
MALFCFSAMASGDIRVALLQGTLDLIVLQALATMGPLHAYALAARLESLRSGSLVRPRFYAVLLGSFAAIAAVLAAVGLYGVLAYSVVLRTHEIGVRMALGANRRAVLAGVLRDGLTTTTFGVAVGLAGAAALTRSLSTMLFGLTALDAPTYVAVAVAFIAVAALASYIPARRATRVDPLIALRCE